MIFFVVFLLMNFLSYLFMVNNRTMMTGVEFIIFVYWRYMFQIFGVLLVMMVIASMMVFICMISGLLMKIFEQFRIQFFVLVDSLLHLDWMLWMLLHVNLFNSFVPDVHWVVLLVIKPIVLMAIFRMMWIMLMSIFRMVRIVNYATIMNIVFLLVARTADWLLSVSKSWFFTIVNGGMLELLLFFLFFDAPFKFWCSPIRMRIVVVLIFQLRSLWNLLLIDIVFLIF